ncbi:hypothetical protein HG536_0G02010 [Torulaspora globosa]|uniref:Vps72/YL1 C-terminal domain-containing protein n=1 Tax=Torulaspora globosa TaxID=48254 RepID=A0A7G3ZLF6_9SACH|nr:uncharacterized protein HG536_0G02010 [Torulaspora globosa]QLL34342.1 hypothetical protein HG536_0G02010 [Torulaspora globosa]
MSDSDIENLEDEYLMATRKRRANAGSKMKKLIAQEVEEMQSKTESLNDDELDLLFKEDAEDEDFEDGKSEESGVEELVEQEAASQVEDNDLLVSESEEEVSEQDDESNEKELQRQESLQQKRKRRSKPPIIKRKAAKAVGTASPAEAVKKKTAYEVLKAESLLVSDRRTSKRSHVVANKLEVYEKLSLAEQKRKIIQERLKKHKEKQNEKVLTQQDRLRLSLETEKLNLQSLDKYKEQEISKKQTRLAIQQRQKTKFKPGEPILRELTTSWIVTPIMEYEDKLYWDEQQRKREKKRKKYPRRQAKKKSPAPAGKDSKLESQQKNGETAVKNENGKAEMAIGNESKDPGTMGPGAVKPSDVTEGQNDGAAGLNGGQKSVKNGISSSNVQRDSMRQAESEPAVIETESRDQMVLIDQGMEQKGLTIESSERKVDEIAINAVTGQPAVSENSRNEDQISQQDELSSSSQIKVESSQNVDGSAADQPPVCLQPENSEVFTEKNGEPSSAGGPHVSFAETDTLQAGQQVSDVSKSVGVNESATPELIDDNGTEEEMILEGPAQEVSKNFVTVYNFGSDSCNFDFRASLFGPQWQGSHNQRAANVENICKISLPENPLSSSEKSPIIPDLSFLSNFPVFGEYGKRVVYDVGLNTGKEMEIEIKTQPPSGVLFSNGVRKKCFITSKECQYFDPKNGVPYSDVEAYKVIQELQDPLGSGSEDSPNPHFQWFGFKNGGVYLDMLQRPASGVPEGF